jgi:hypothetical protein
LERCAVGYVGMCLLGGPLKRSKRGAVKRETNKENSECVYHRDGEDHFFFAWIMILRKCERCDRVTWDELYCMGMAVEKLQRFAMHWTFVVRVRERCGEAYTRCDTLSINFGSDPALGLGPF